MFAFFYSWEMHTKDIVVKQCDTSVFKHHGSGIPIETRWFWGVENLKYPQKIDLVLNYLGQEYRAYIESDKKNRTRLIWYQDLANLLKQQFNENIYPLPSLRFARIGVNHYEISFINACVIEMDDNDRNESKIIEITGASEGKRIARYCTKYERDQRNRVNAIKIHGTKCMVCGFDFERTYGIYGRDFIEVHHIKPLYNLEKEEFVDPRTDLVCLCSNCHRMIHRKRDSILTIDELRQIIKT